MLVDDYGRDASLEEAAGQQNNSRPVRFFKKPDQYSPSFFKQLLDGYAFSAPCKGSFCTITPKVGIACVIIT